MQFLFRCLLSASVLAASVTSITIPVGNSAFTSQATSANVTTIVQFPKGTWLENVAARSNGNLVMVLIDRPEVWEVNPRSATPMPKLVHRFDNATRTTGITEVAPDIFAVIVGNLPIGALTGGTWALWTLDLSSGQPNITQVTAVIPQAQFLNGLTLLSPTAVLASESALGVVYAIDLRTGRANVVLNDKTMSPMLIPLGVNGVHVRNGYLYYSNTAQGIFARIPVNSATGTSTGPAETIYKDNDYIGSDDFAISPSGDAAFATVQFTNSIFQFGLKSKGKKEIIVDGNLFSGQVIGPTSLVFSRVKGEENTVYICTNNGALPWALGIGQVGGGVFSVKLS